MLAGSYLPNNPPRTAVDSEQKCDLLMWAQGTNSILEMRVVNMDMASYIIKTLEKSLVTAEREKNRKY